MKIIKITKLSNGEHLIIAAYEHQGYYTTDAFLGSYLTWTNQKGEVANFINSLKFFISTL